VSVHFWPRKVRTASPSWNATINRGASRSKTHGITSSPSSSRSSWGICGKLQVRPLLILRSTAQTYIRYDDWDDLKKICLESGWRGEEG
jgi:hypothetical protein